MRGRLLFTVVVVAFALGLVTLATAQDASKRIQPTTYAQATSTLRTPQMMDAFEATSVAPTPRVAPFRPTMDINSYRALKQQARAASGSKPLASQGALSPPVTGSLFAGPSQCQGSGTCWFPPDVAATSGAYNDIVAVHNSMFAVYSNSGTQLRLISLNAFFGYSTQPFFDPRVVYDSVWSRYCVTSAAFPESATIQIYGIACTVNGNPMGGWHVYLFNVGQFIPSGGFYDFPMVGDSQDAVIFSANVFGPSTFAFNAVYALSKATLFNGRGFSIPVFEPNYGGTVTPARELIDGNGYAWLASNNASGNIAMFAFGYPASPPDSHLYGPYNVTVAAYSVPPGAPQPTCTASTDLVDTSDTRFVNMGIQNGDAYYQTHTVGIGAYAIPKYYIIRGLLSFTPTVAAADTNYFYASGTSQDFNASIAADGGNRMVLNWTSVDAPNGINPQIRFTGRLSSDPAVGGPGTVLYTSPACLSGNYDSNFGEQRWGDYSQASSDPATSGQFWIDNETVPNTNSWGTVIGRIHF